MEDIYKLVIKNLTKALDEFVGECLDENDKPQTPSIQSLYKIRGSLPIWCKHTIVKKK